MGRTRDWLVVVCCGVLVLAGCTGGSKPAASSSTAAPSTSSASPLPTSTSTSRAPKPATRRVDPLTGLPVRVVARRPVLVVKVDNAPEARPQTGLNNAGLVLEELVEGGITRF